jgi:putative transcriptional regulator
MRLFFHFLLPLTYIGKSEVSLREFVGDNSLKRLPFTKELNGFFEKLALALPMVYLSAPISLKFYTLAMPNSSNHDEGFDPQAQAKKLKAGVLLLAREMSDPNFSASAVLICQHGAEGSYGLVLNRPSHMPLSEVFGNIPEWAGGSDRPQRIFIGGPVQPEELQVVHVTETPVPGSHKISDGVYLGGYWDGLKGILDHNSNTIRMFLGYSGWGAAQLAHEVELGAWEVLSPDLKQLLLSPDTAWQGGTDSIKAFLSTL